LVTGFLEGLSLEVMHLLRLNWKNKFWWLCPLIASYRGSKSCCSENLRKTALLGGFFVYGDRDYDY